MRYRLNYSGTRFLSTENQNLLDFLMDSVLKFKLKKTGDTYDENHYYSLLLSNKTI